MKNRVPSNKEAEQAVLASVILDNKVKVKVLNELEERDFYFQENINVFNAIKLLEESNKEIDVTSISDILSSRELLESTGGFSYLVELNDMLPSSHNVKTYIDIVKAKSLSRQVVDACLKIQDKIVTSDSHEIEDILDYAEGEIYSITNKRSAQEFDAISLVMDELTKTIDSRVKGDQRLSGISSGYAYYDKLTQGFQPGELIILAARPAMGKSAFAINLALNVAKSNKSVAIFTLEMSSEQVGMRMLSRESLVDSGKIRSGQLENIEWAKVSSVAEKLKKLNIFFDDSSSVKISELYTKCRQLHQQGKLDFLLIDYLQLLSGSSANANNRVVEIGEISRKLKSLARDLEIPVLALSQLSRSVETRSDKRPLMSDLRESGSIEQDADIVMFLYREDYYASSGDTAVEEKVVETVELDIKKNRSGGLGVVKLSFNKRCGAFTSYIDTSSSINNKI